MRIMIADDDPTTLLMLEAYLHELGHDVVTSTNGIEALDKLKDNDFRVLITDWEMPGMDGLELSRRIRARRLGPYVYVILLTSKCGQQNLIEGLAAGADDFVTKPFQPEEIRVRLRAAERITSLESRDLVIFALARLAESRDSDTGAHLERIREYSRLLAMDLSVNGPYKDQIDSDFVQTIYLTSPLHDIGKVGIPDHILLKPGKLTPAEFNEMKQHTDIGRVTLEDAMASYPNAEFLRIARDIAWTHHERFDGSGYPRGLIGQQIPLCGRIVSVADVYDAMTSQRTYKPAFSHAYTAAEILAGSGTAFDPAVVDAFARCEEEFRAIRHVHHPDVPPEYAPSSPSAAPTFGQIPSCQVASLS
jgi:putative two-component system response regulator